MKSLWAFYKKELLEGIRTKRFIIVAAIFFVFGVMNPLIAKITPWLMESLSESLKESGFEMTEVTIDAITSWQQYYKNISMILIVFVLLFSATFTSEYQKGTLVNVVTKGLARWKIVVSKSINMLVLWTLGMVLCTGITYGYNAVYWDNSIANNLIFSVVLYWLFGVMVMALLVLFSSICSSVGSVLALTGGSLMIMYILSIWDKAANVLPIKLTDGMSLVTGVTEKSEYVVAIVVSCAVVVVSMVISVVKFNKREL